MNKNDILIKYNLAIKQAELLEEAALKIEKLAAEQLGSSAGRLKNNWKSDNSARFFGKLSNVQNDITVNADDLRKVALSIRNTAESTRNCELRAADNKAE